MSNRELLNFSENLKKTSLGVRFGKTLLQNPDSINPKIVFNVMKELGFPITKDMQMSVDAAQAIVTGAAVINRVNIGDYTDYKELIKPSVTSIAALSRIANQLGMIDNKTASLLALGTDVALIFASGGLDMNAWIRVAMSIASETQRADAVALQKAQTLAVEAMKNKYQQEAKDFSQNIQDLQNGKLGFFSFLAESVDEIPLMFPNLIQQNPSFQFLRNAFPGLKFLPVGPWTFSAEASESTFWGEEKTKKFSVDVQGLAKSNQQSAVDFILQFVIYPQAANIVRFQKEWMKNQKADLFNVALFSLFDKSFYLKTEMDLMTIFSKAQVTPYEIGELDTFRTAIDTASKAVTTNFGFGLEGNRLPKAILVDADKSGNIDLISKDSQAASLIRKKFDFPITTLEQKGFIDQNFDPRNMANFLSVLDMLDLIYKDPQYENIKKQSKLLSYFDQFPKIDEFGSKFSLLMNKSVTRRVNKAARVNVQALTGIPTNKLQVLTRDGQASIFK